MKIAIKELFDAFPSYEVAIKPRPDGKLLLTLRKEGEPVLSRAIDSEAVFCEKRIRLLIHEILRDIKLAAGEVSWQGRGSQWVSATLPTFTGGPVNPTAAKLMWARRSLQAATGNQAA